MTTPACPKGYICGVVQGSIVNPAEAALCSDLQTQVKEAGYGNILQGIYCPGGESAASASLKNCPAGHYCEDAGQDPKVCPKGYYCPVKTANYTDFPCRWCEEGSDRYAYNLTAIISLGVIIGIFALLIFVRNRSRSKKLADTAKKISQFDKAAKERENDELKRLLSILETIDERLGEKYEIDESDHRELLDFDPNYLFDAIDEDGNNVLTYSELDKAMLLTGEKLLAFIKMMNEADDFEGTSSTRKDQNQVSRETFVKHFLPVMKRVAYFDPSPDEIDDLFDEMSKVRDKIRISDLKYSSLAMFLGDHDVRKLEVFFRNKLAEKKYGSHNAQNEVYDLGGGENFVGNSEDIVDNNSFEGKEDFSGGGKEMIKPKSFRKSLAGSLAPTKKMNGMRRSVAPGQSASSRISKSEFRDWLPEALQDLVRGDDSAQEPIDIYFKDLTLDVNGKDGIKKIVNGITGRIEVGKMTAVMGGSGTGKTSLLNTLCGRAYYGNVGGYISVNGQEETINRCIDVVGFVPQDDIVFAELTVRENLIYAGKFMLPKGTPMEDIEDLADDVIADLGLSRVADSLVGDVTRRGISGGEKKRVNIGLELMGRPSILFLDEPTSGLDSNSAMIVMESLRSLVQRNGMTICTVIHQPRKTIYELMDTVILLGTGGNIVYHGPTKEARDYFARAEYDLPEGESLADWLIDISSGDLDPAMKVSDNLLMSMRGSSIANFEMTDAKRLLHNRERLYKFWDDNGVKKEKPAKFDLPSKRETPGFLSQTMYHFSRCFLLFERNIATEMQDALIIVGGSIAILLLEKGLTLTKDLDPNIPNEYYVLNGVGQSPEQTALFESVAVPLLYLHAIKGFMTILNYATKMSLPVCLLTALSSTKALTEKRTEFFRETNSGYSVNAYYLALNLFDTLKVSVKMVVVALFAVFLRNTGASVFATITQFILLGWLSSSWGLIFPLFVPADNVVLVTGFFVIFTSLLFAGAPSTPIEYEAMYSSSFMNILSSFLSPPRFFLESLAINEFKTTPEQHGFTVESNYGFSTIGVGEGDNNVFVKSRSGWYWGVAPAIFVGLTIRILGFILIHSCNRSQQLKQPLWKDLKADSFVRLGALFFTLLLVICAVLSMLFFLPHWSNHSNSIYLHTGLHITPQLKGPAFAMDVASIGSTISCATQVSSKNRSAFVWAVKGYAGGPLAVSQVQSLDNLITRGEAEAEARSNASQ